MATLQRVPEEVQTELDWEWNYTRKEQMERIAIEVLNETNLRVQGLAVGPLCRLDYWYSEEACEGFDVLEFLLSGKVFVFSPDLEALETVLAACESDAVIPVRNCTGSMEEDQRVFSMQVLGPVHDDRVLRALLRYWRQEMESFAAQSAWMRALLCLYDLYERASEPDMVLDRLREATALFDSYDGEFCAHSAGELYARPFLDCAALLAHANVRFEQERPGVFKAHEVLVLSERHFEEFVVPGLALLLLAHLEKDVSLTRFDSVRYSGDRCWIASFGCELLPAGLFGWQGTFSEGARFVFFSEHSIRTPLTSFDNVQFVIVVERNLRLVYLAPAEQFRFLLNRLG